MKLRVVSRHAERSGARASCLNGRGPELPAVQDMPVVAGEMLILFDCVEDDRTERSPAGKRRLTASQRESPDRHMRKIAAGLRAGIVDHAEIAIEEDAAFS